MTYYEWSWKLRKIIQCWKLGISTILIMSDCQDVEITKTGTKLVSKINGLKCDYIIFDELGKL